MTITTKNLSKTYGKTRAVRDVSLSVDEGEIYGFLGLNGAGKTTTIRMLLGMIRPTTGSARIQGQTVSAGSYRLWRDVGYLVETPYAYPDLTVIENLEIIRKLRGIDDATATATVIDKLSLGDHAHKQAKHLSLGNAQRLGLAKALIHDPKILLLDEPTNGLDPAGIVEIRNLLLTMAHEQGVTIFVSSHLLTEMSLIADRIGIIHLGQLIKQMNVQEFERERRKSLIVDTADNHKAIQTMLANGYAASEHDGSIRCEDARAIDYPEVITMLLANAGFPPCEIRVEAEDLEDYFLRVIGGAR